MPGYNLNARIDDAVATIKLHVDLLSDAELDFLFRVAGRLAPLSVAELRRLENLHNRAIDAERDWL